MRSQRPMSILPPGMDGGPQNGAHLEDRPTHAVDTAGRSLGRNDEFALQRAWPSMRKTTMRSVTPEKRVTGERISASPTNFEHASPRSIPGGEKPKERRAGLVFEDAYRADAPEPKRSGPPVSFQPSRPRTRTLDESHRHRSASHSLSKSRHRVGSVYSTGSSPFHDVEPRTLPDGSGSLGSPSMATPSPTTPLSKSNSVKGGKKLVKRASRPTSPVRATLDVPFVDSLPSPVLTGDANKILILMKTLCGRMKGEAEYQTSESSAWDSGTCYIDDVKGSLMFEGEEKGQAHVPIISDLRSCRVRPLTLLERDEECLEITNRARGIEVWLVPSVKAEFDLWLAALLCWQQIRNAVPTASPPGTGDRRPPSGRRNSSFTQLSLLGVPKSANIIKVAKLLLWDNGAPASPRAIVRRPSTRALRSPTISSWRKVSCILQDNGEFKLLTENDVTLLSVIQLSQLSRCAIQRLDRTVLDEDYCIAILPQYTPTSTQLSIFRPVYICLESRLIYEVWFCLLRAFTIPEIYGPQASDPNEDEMPASARANDDMFRIEKTLNLRVVEAKMRKPVPVVRPETSQGRASTKPEFDPFIGDYFAEVLLDGELRSKTNIKTETRNPFWREDCEFQDLPAYTPKLSVALKRLERLESSHILPSSMPHNLESKAEFTCGIVEVPIDKLERGKDNETWWPILDHQEEQIGELFLKVRHEEIVVLLSKEYQEVSELLHRFSNGLTIQIAQSAPSHLKPISETLMNIFQVSGHAGDWLMALVEDEIDGIGKENNTIRRVRWSKRIGSNESFNSSSDREQNVRDIGKSLQGEANLLFRGNSLLTQALDSHMRRLGKEYLDEVLSKRVAEINALDSDCEVDPSRIAQGEDVAKNWTQLISLTVNVWKSIAGSAARCPPELRQILKYIRAVAEDRYGDFLRSVAYTSVSGFLFLRFFCPALLNPKLFGLLRDHPKPKAQRALTLVAKSLQALANLSTFGAKESWMEPMNRFLASHRQGVKDYIDNVCDIPADRNTTFAVPASYSTPITILARLPPTSREGFPSLPYLIDHTRNFAILVKLWLEATSRYVALVDMDGDIGKFHQLCIDLKKRTDECLLKAEQEDRAGDHLSLQWEDIVESLESSSILYEVGHSDVDLQSPISPSYTVMGRQEYRDIPGSAGSSVDPGSKDKKDRQSFWESTFGKENKNQRPYEPGSLDVSQSSPPNRGQSRNGKASRNFLSGLRRKEKEKEKDKEKDKEKEKEKGKEKGGAGKGEVEGQSWNGKNLGNGGMI